jgi:undecaprenyl-diphosphatase
MNTLQILFTALIQGITEFLPISSSAHLILLPKIMNWVDQGLEIDVAVHLGTLMAVMLYFFRDVFKIAGGFFDLCKNKKTNSRHLFVNLVVATIPVVIIGLIAKDIIENDLRSAAVIAATSIIFGVVLFISDRRINKTNKEIDTMPLKDAVWIGLWQAIALIPGVSRSGITMTAALFLGYSRTDSAKFSLLLSMPTILAASLLIIYDMMQKADLAKISDAILAGIASFLVAYLVIWGMMAWLKRFSFTPFVIYRVLLGIIIFIVLF